MSVESIAYGWFEDLEFILPDGIDLVDGPYPGSDWRGVIVKDLKTLIELQMFLCKLCHDKQHQ